MSPPLFWLIWASAVIVGESTRSSSGTDLLDSNLLLYEDAVYHLINSSLGLESAQSYCRGGLSILTTAGVRENEVAAHKLLSQSHLKGPIWFGMNQQPKPATHLDFSKQTFAETTLPGFSFKTKDGFARVNASFPSLSAISVCVRVQWDPGHENISTVFSYAAPVLTNEFQLRGQIDESRSRNGKRPVLLALLIQGHHHPYKAELPLDTHWHHVCVTWRAADGLWAIYVDGKIGDSRKDAVTSRNISANGIFILGQDQDTFGGTFTEPFVGNMTDLNVWHEALSLEQVKVLDACTPPTNKSLVFGWRDRRLTVHPSLTNMSATLKCAESVKASPRVKEECAVLSGWSEGQSQFNTEPCTNKHPFICRSSKEQYLKIKEVRQSFTSNPSPFMQQLIEHGMTADDVISDSVDGQSWSSVSLLLNVSQQVMVEQEKQLESRDMVSLMMLLSRAADLPSSDNQSRGDVQSLGQNFITLADSLLSQDNTSKWSSIKEVVKGPMVVIQTVDRMVSNLNSLLTADTDHVQIHSDNIKLQVQQKTLSDTSSSVSSAFCGLDVGSQDCISVPAKILKELHNSGFGKVTLLNTWYNSVSVKCLTEPEENVTVVPVVSDGSQRYLRTVLGSSVISSTVLVDGRPLSMAIHFTLQHRVQNTLMKPVCAFWDFGLPAGGGWSTKGCDVISSYDNATSCYCNHTTNFALLMQMYEVQRSSEEEKSLQILSLIGSGVSLCGLVFTFILFVAVGVPKSDRTTVHKNLIVALAVAQLLFIFSDWASGNQEACWLVTALLHLFFLSSFCWMLVEGLLLWSKVVSVNISEERRMKLYYLLGWGLPVVVVAVTLSATLDQYKAERYCWLNLKSNVIWAFIGPVLFILAVNAVVLFRVVLVTLASARRRAKMLTPSSESKLHALDLTWAATRPVLILLPVLGLTWLCGVLLHLSDVLAYLFITLNAFQGLYIFLVYAVYNSEVRSAIRRIQEKRKALSFTNCSQPVSFLPSQKSPSASWAHSLPTHSSSDNSTANSLVFKNERFRDNSAVSFSMKTPSRGQVVQLTAFKPSGC